MGSRRRSRPSWKSAVATWLAILVLPGSFIAAGSAALYASMKHRQWARESVSWPQVTGRVVSITGRKGSSTITYAYGAGGKFYQTSRAAFGSLYPGEANRLARRLKPGQDIRVYVHPTDPSTSVLFPGPKPGNWGLPLTGTLGIAAGLGMLWLMAKGDGED
jgi:hypothetical protein